MPMDDSNEEEQQHHISVSQSQIGICIVRVMNVVYYSGRVTMYRANDDAVRPSCVRRLHQTEYHLTLRRKVPVTSYTSQTRRRTISSTSCASQQRPSTDNAGCLPPQQPCLCTCNRRDAAPPTYYGILQNMPAITVTRRKVLAAGLISLIHVRAGRARTCLDPRDAAPPSCI